MSFFSLSFVLSLALVGGLVQADRFSNGLSYDDRQQQPNRDRMDSPVDEYPLLARIQGTEYVLTPDVVFPRRQGPWPALMASKRSALGVDLPEYLLHYKTGGSDVMTALKQKMMTSGRRR